MPRVRAAERIGLRFAASRDDLGDGVS